MKRAGQVQHRKNRQRSLPRKSEPPQKRTEEEELKKDFATKRAEEEQHKNEQPAKRAEEEHPQKDETRQRSGPRTAVQEGRGREACRGVNSFSQFFRFTLVR